MNLTEVAAHDGTTTDAARRGNVRDLSVATSDLHRNYRMRFRHNLAQGGAFPETLVVGARNIIVLQVRCSPYREGKS
jgi:hypothetical protein